MSKKFTGALHRKKMSVLEDQYLYDTYCGSVLPPPEQQARIRKLAENLSVPIDEDPCLGIAKRRCRVNRLCENNDTYDSVEVQCGDQPPECISATAELQNWQRVPKREYAFSPKDRAIVRRIKKQRGTPRERAKLTCVERRGHQTLCEEKPSCVFDEASRDCEVRGDVTSCEETLAREVLLDELLRKQPNLLELSGNARRKIANNIQSLTPIEICRAWEEFFPVVPLLEKTSDNVSARLNAITAMILSPEDTIDTKDIQKLFHRWDVDLGRTAPTFVAILNAIVAAVSTQAPWWFYFTAYPSGRQAFESMMQGQGEILKLSLLLSGMSGNILFQDIPGLLSNVSITNNESINALVPTLSGILVRQIGNVINKKST